VNLCPFCKESWVICKLCGFEFSRCPKCDTVCEVWINAERDPGDRRLTYEAPHPGGRVLEGRLWDGSDFIQTQHYFYVSRRAFEWFASTHAGPIWGMKARFCVDGLSQDQQRWLDEARDLQTVEVIP
jgi:hypothetical protein